MGNPQTAKEQRRLLLNLSEQLIDNVLKIQLLIEELGEQTDRQITNFSSHVDQFSAAIDALNGRITNNEQQMNEQAKVLQNIQDNLQLQNQLIRILLINELSRTLGEDGESILEDLLDSQPRKKAASTNKNKSKSVKSRSNSSRQNGRKKRNSKQEQ